MGRPMKRLLVVGAVVLVLVAIAVTYLLSNLDSIVKNTIERYGSEATGTTVHVERVEISLRNGTGSVHGLTVANPAGYSDGYAARLGSAVLVVDLATAQSTPLVLQRVTVSALEVRFETATNGTTNFDVLARNVAGGAGGGVDDVAESETDSDLLLRIDRLEFEKGRIAATAPALGGAAYEVDLPAFTMTGVGGTSGASPDRIAQQVTRELIERVTRSVVHKGVRRVVEDQIDGLLRKFR